MTSHDLEEGFLSPLLYAKVQRGHTSNWQVLTVPLGWKLLKNKIL